jgi:hypothetical protein
MDFKTLHLLIELYEDVQRWRETGGDPRDLRYVLETAEAIDPQAVEELRERLKHEPTNRNT